MNLWLYIRMIQERLSNTTNVVGLDVLRVHDRIH